MSKKNRGKRKRHVFRTWVKGLKTVIATPVPSDDARVEVETLISRADAEAGASGIAVACAIQHKCIVTPNLFPHPVYHIEVSRSRVAVVDKIDKRTKAWKHCIVYKHNRVKWTKEFDRPGGKAELLRYWNKDVPVVLSPPRATPYRADGRPRGKNDGSRSTKSVIIPRKGSKHGPMRRWCDAIGGAVPIPG